MVQKYQSPVRVYKHPFELIMAVSTPPFRFLLASFLSFGVGSVSPALLLFCFHASKHYLECIRHFEHGSLWKLKSACLFLKTAPCLC